MLALFIKNILRMGSDCRTKSSRQAKPGPAPERLSVLRAYHWIYKHSQVPHLSASQCYELTPSFTSITRSRT